MARRAQYNNAWDDIVSVEGLAITLRVEWDDFPERKMVACGGAYEWFIIQGDKIITQGLDGQSRGVGGLLQLYPKGKFIEIALHSNGAPSKTFMCMREKSKFTNSGKELRIEGFFENVPSKLVLRPL